MFQETYLANNCHITLKLYNCISKQGTYNRRYHGGVALFVHESCPYEEIELNLHYQIVAVRVILAVRTQSHSQTYIYQGGLHWTWMSSAESQTPTETILGDFNAHETDWRNRHTDSRGRVIEQYIDRQQLNMLNSGAPSHTSDTAIELTITSPEVTPDCECQVYESVVNSDHFPIILTIAKSSNEIEPGSNFNYKKANWQEYSREKVWKELPGEKQAITVNTLVDDFYNRLYTATENHIPR